MDSNRNLPHPRTTSELARRLGISRWTVSRVLNGHQGIREATRRRVMEAVESMDFEPNWMGRGLRGGRSGLVGVIFQDWNSPVTISKMSLITSDLLLRGYTPMVEWVPPGQPLRHVFRRLSRFGMEGWLLVGTSAAGEYEEVARTLPTKASVVVVDGGQPSAVFPSVTLDRAGGIERLVHHLYQRGHRRLGVLGLTEGGIFSQGRREGLKRSLERWPDLHLNYLPRVVCEDHYAMGERGCFPDILRSDALTSLVCLDDRVAIGALRGLSAEGLDVPGQVAVTGFDNLPVSAYSQPPLTTVDQNIPALMSESLQMLVALLEGRTLEDMHLKVSPILIERDSTASLG